MMLSSDDDASIVPSGKKATALTETVKAGAGRICGFA
jgi:hypothetical protein